CIPLAMVDPDFAKKQLILMLREWYMAPNGQIPAYEWNFSDVNPPVHAWASMQVYLMEKKQQGSGDISFLKRVFQKLMINFTWWVNQKDANGNNVFEGGFLGLDNIGVFDRSSEIPGGGHLEQADGSAWMATYALNLMEMALEISLVDPDFEDVATKFFEHFTLIAHALNHRGQKDFALWDEKEGLYFDLLILPGGEEEMIRVRSLVGLAPMFAVSIVRKEQQQKLKDFMRRMSWFRRHKLKDEEMTMLAQETENEDILLSIVSPKKLRRVLHAMLDEKEFLSPYGIRSLSKIHEKIPYKMQVNEQVYSIRYQPGESDTNMFGGNSNWRGPVWFPMNYMLIEALMTYHDYLGDDFRVAFPTGSRNMLNLAEVAREISLRLIKLFEKDKNGKRPVYPKKDFHHRDPYSQDLILFYEYFHGDNGRGVGASHQTGWTGLVANLIDRFA
ncbi:MAG: glucosidase, partial [Bacteroidota bacterium]